MWKIVICWTFQLISKRNSEKKKNSIFSGSLLILSVLQVTAAKPGIVGGEAPCCVPKWAEWEENNAVSKKDRFLALKLN